MGTNPNARALHHLFHPNDVLLDNQLEQVTIDFDKLKNSVATVAPLKFLPKFGYPPPCAPPFAPPVYDGTIQEPFKHKALSWKDVGEKYHGPENKAKRRRLRQRNSQTVKRREGYIKRTLQGNYVLHGKRKADLLRNLVKSKIMLTEAEFQVPFETMSKRTKKRLTGVKKRLQHAVKDKQTELQIRTQFHEELKYLLQKIKKKFQYDDVSEQEDFSDEDADAPSKSDLEDISENELIDDVPPRQDGELEEGEIASADKMQELQQSEMSKPADNIVKPVQDDIPAEYIQTLNAGKDISSRIVDYILLLLGSHELDLKVLPVDSSFYLGRYQKIRSPWFRNVDFGKIDVLLIPICEYINDKTNHWLLLKVSPNSRICEIVDSVRGFWFGVSEAKAVLQMVYNSANTPRRQSFPHPDDFQIYRPEVASSFEDLSSKPYLLQFQEPGSNDCGVFVIMRAIQICLGIPIKNLCQVFTNDRQKIREMIFYNKVVVPEEYEHRQLAEFRKTYGYFTYST